MRERLVSQLARPVGLLGRQAAREMAMVNRQMIRSAIELLDVAAGHAVLEIGFARGASLSELVTRVGNGRVAGVDHSPTMVRVARRRLARHVRAGIVELHEGSAGSLPVADGTVDRVLAVNTTTYWPDLVEGLRDMHRVMRRSALAVVSVRSPELLERIGVGALGGNLTDEAALSEAAATAGLTVASSEQGRDRMGEFFHLVLHA